MRSVEATPPDVIFCNLCGLPIYPAFNLGVWLHQWGSSLCSDARGDQREFGVPESTHSGEAT